MKTGLILIALFIGQVCYAQVENVPLNHQIYDYLKEMKVKHVIGSTHDDSPNLSRLEVQNFLIEIRKEIKILSATEKNLLIKYEAEFFEDEITEDKHWQMLNYKDGFWDNLGKFDKDKIKYLYAYKDENVKAYFEGTAHFIFGQQYKPQKTNSELYDIGFRFRGTLLEKFGFYFSLEKGGISGSKNFASIVEPRLNTNFKFIEDMENVANYDYVNGYVNYYSQPVKNMHVSLQFGREQLKFGYGYGSKFVISGDNPNMDFLKFNFRYGFVDYTTIHASTVGEFNFDRSQNFTKYIALNKFGFLVNDKLRLGIGNSIVYSGRGLDFAYLNPFTFYKFVEMSIQDRDNGTVFFDIQSNHIKNLELQASFFMDENFLNKLGEMSRFSNKTAYQLGAFWYEPFSIPDVSLIFEYTKIRPYTYSHISGNDSYTSFGTNLGHRIGPNSDEILTKLSYNLCENIRFNAEYSFVRSGENILSPEGIIIKNVGGDVFEPHIELRDSEEAVFLDGIRINSNILLLNLRIEPIRDLSFDIYYKYIFEENITHNFKNDLNYGYIKMTAEF